MMVPPAQPRGVRRGRLVLGAAVLAGLLGVFALYTRPGFLVLMVDQIWACF